jgi:cystathionine beta-lyase
MSVAYDFDRVIERRGTGSFKWDHFGQRDILPMWVADMDFPAPPCVQAALHAAVDHGVFGYAQVSPALQEATVAMLARRYQWAVQPEWLVWLPGLVYALNLCCRAVGGPGDEVLTVVPIYPPFLKAPGHGGRRVVKVPARLEAGRWCLPVEELAAAITPRTRLLLLCNPHNPLGRAWSRAELEAVGALALRHGLVVCADEIHADLVLDPVPHLPLASLSPELAARTLTLMAPSKTFNTPGLATSFAIIPDETLRHQFNHQLRQTGAVMSCLGLAATEAAFRDGEPWRLALLDYLRGNRDLVEDFVARELPQVAMPHVEATYLAWLDVSRLGLADPAAHCERHGLALSDGRFFDAPGHLRLNFGCPRVLLHEGLRRLRTALTTPA